MGILLRAAMQNSPQIIRRAHGRGAGARSGAAKRGGSELWDFSFSEVGVVAVLVSHMPKAWSVVDFGETQIYNTQV